MTKTSANQKELNEKVGDNKTGWLVVTIINIPLKLQINHFWLKKNPEQQYIILHQ